MRVAASLRVVLVALLLDVGVLACDASPAPADRPALDDARDTSPKGHVDARAGASPDATAQVRARAPGGELALASASVEASRSYTRRRARHPVARASATVERSATPATPTPQRPLTIRATPRADAPDAARPPVAAARSSAAAPEASDATSETGDETGDLDLFERDDDEPAEAAPSEPEGEVTYRAWALPGARHRVVIARASHGPRPNCTRVVLVHPQNVEQWALLPAGWAIEHAWTTAEPASCSDRRGIPQPGDAGTMDGDGRVAWAKTHGVLPCELEIELALSFPATSERAAHTINFQRGRLAVEGCRSPGPLTAAVAVSN
ncbi:MAG: hypothetical protein H6713_42110 [Myxococcales bacterium]|nr:hypothetical protein [Myxococcales bacterium]